ncbi:unnamed protein product, partial [Pelagomonas calceolata]
YTTSYLAKPSFFSAAKRLSRLAIKKSKSSLPMTRFSPLMSLWISGIAMPLTEKAATIITTPGAVCQGMVPRSNCAAATASERGATRLRSVRAARFRGDSEVGPTARAAAGGLGRRQRRAAGARDCVEALGRRSARFSQQRWIRVIAKTLCRR